MKKWGGLLILQIWAHEYVDLSTLLYHRSETVEAVQVGDNGNLKLTKQKAPRKIESLGDWCDAFLVYLTVYCRKYPQEIASLTTYLNTVKSLSLKGGRLS